VLYWDITFILIPVMFLFFVDASLTEVADSGCGNVNGKSMIMLVGVVV